MDIVENKVINNLFKSFLTIGLVGILLYLIQEIIPAMVKEPYPAFIVVADFFGILAVIGFIVWMFIPVVKNLTRNITILLGLLYVFFFIFAHFFITMYNPIAGNFIEKFSGNGASFIGLMLIGIFTVGLIVFISMQLDKAKELHLFEKFIIILWFLVIFVYDAFSGSFYSFRQAEPFGTVVPILQLTFGITFLPAGVEMIFLLFAAIIIGFAFFLKPKQDVILLLLLLLLNGVFLTLTISTVSVIGFDSAIAYTPAKMGNGFLIIGTLGIVITTFFVLLEKYGVGLHGKPAKK